MKAALTALGAEYKAITNDALTGWRVLWRGPTAVHWYEAEEYCENEGGELIKIESQSMQDIFAGRLECRSVGCWLGFRPCDHAFSACGSIEAWRWKDGSQSNPARSFFASGEPNMSAKPYVSCIIGAPYFDGLWDDVGCYENRYPVCQTSEGFFPVFFMVVFCPVVIGLGCWILYRCDRCDRKAEESEPRKEEDRVTSVSISSQELDSSTVDPFEAPRQWGHRAHECTHDAFLAHSWQSTPGGPSDTHDVVERIARALDSAHHLACWIDSENITYVDYSTAMYNGIRASRIFVAFATREYLRKANSSVRSHVKNELDYAIDESMHILWVMLEPGLARFAEEDWGALNMRANPRRHIYVDMVDVFESEQAFASKVDNLAVAIRRCIRDLAPDEDET